MSYTCARAPGPPVFLRSTEGAQAPPKAEQLAPNHPEILLELAQAYAKVGEVELARQTYIRCVDKGPLGLILSGRAKTPGTTRRRCSRR